jgi:hypothetical protein
VAVIVEVPFKAMEAGVAWTVIVPADITAPASLLPPESLLQAAADMSINSSTPYIRVVLTIDKVIFIFPSCYKIQLR